MMINHVISCFSLWKVHWSLIQLVPICVLTTSFKEDIATNCFVFLTHGPRKVNALISSCDQVDSSVYMYTQTSEVIFLYLSTEPFHKPLFLTHHSILQLDRTCLHVLILFCIIVMKYPACCY